MPIHHLTTSRSREPSVRGIHRAVAPRIAAWLLAPALAAGAGCSEVDCGEGTFEQGGSCVPADAISGEASSCGPGTHYDLSLLTCVADLPPTRCGAFTEQIVGPDGVIECQGVESEGCSGPFQCPAPTTAGRATICGQILDIETDQPLRKSTAAGLLCDPDAPADSGACALTVDAYDALAFAANPTGATPLPRDKLEWDDCGRFRAQNIEVPVATFIGFAVNDAAGRDAVVLTGVADAFKRDETRRGFALFATRNETDSKWTAGAGNPFGGTSFAQKGVFLEIFRHKGQPVAGVQMTRNNATEPADDYYFSDVGGTLRATVSPAQAATGLNGTGLMVNSEGLQNHGGTGAERDGCEWPVAYGVALPGVVFASIRNSFDPLTGEPCR
jgi:hypothetical protein